MRSRSVTCGHTQVVAYNYCICIVYTATIRQAGRTPHTRASAAVESSPSSDFSSPMNLLISVGDSGYSRQVDTEPVGIDIGAVPVHTVSGMMCVLDVLMDTLP